jgi:AcrR family transcriptional regulator
MGRKKDPAREAERRQQIMATCYQLLVTRSHEAMTLEAVANELGGSKGQIAHYFPSKEALITATMRSALELYAQTMVVVAESDLPLRDRLRHIIAIALPDREELWQRFAFIVEVWSFSKSSNETAETVRAAFASMRTITRRLLEIGVEAGFVKRKDLERQVVLVAALFDGLALHAAHTDVDVAELRAEAERIVVEMLGLEQRVTARRRRHRPPSSRRA